MNISIKNAYKRSDEVATSLYATESMLEEGDRTDLNSRDDLQNNHNANKNRDLYSVVNS